MSLHLETVKNLSGYSLAKYATWIYYKPDNLLFDAGEGVSIAMRNKIYAVENVFLTHGHGDHIGGLPGFLSSRASSMGDQDKPLALYYPKGDRSIGRLRRYIQESLGSLPFEVSWTELDAGDRVPLAGRRFLEAFPSRHNQNLSTLGYRILEQRTRLRSECRDLPQEELIAAIKKLGKDSVTESYEQTILCFSGDSMPLPVEVVRGAEVLVHDCTFLEEADREEDTHATLEETLNLAIAAGVSLLALFHFSTRYSRQQIAQTLRRRMRERRIEFPIYYMLPNLHAFEFKELEAPHE